ncbi:MAG: hypothetical protein RI969_134 [Verrucomicrobiota bacterium]|jgi:hypothetical protein
MRPLALALLAALALVPPAEALQMTKKAIRNQGIFGIKVNNTDMAFYGRADAILSISFQEYTTGPFIVSEVVIDMKDSNQQLRIYNTRPPGSADFANRANRASAANAENRGLDPKDASTLAIPAPLAAIETKLSNVASNSTGDIVVKTYPNTTHAKTVEMVVSSKAELQNLYARLIALYTGFEVEAMEGASIEGSNAAKAAAATAAAATGTTAAKIKINQIGGVLFTLE